MAAIRLPAPGTKLGPCSTTCSHIDCLATRLIADGTCRICHQCIGYEVLIFQDPDPDARPLVAIHAGCLDPVHFLPPEPDP